MSQFILSHFPRHTVYLEPCFGAGSVLIRKQRSKIETVNDLDGLITNFFTVLRDCPEDLVKALKLTPWSRDEVAKSPDEGDGPLEKARRMFMYCWATIGQNQVNSFRISKNPRSQPARIMTELDYLFEISKRMRGVQIENIDALEFIDRYAVDGCLIYFDPPYTKDTRTMKEAYRLDVDVQFHIDASHLLRSKNCFCIVSGYNSQLYSDIYSDWKRVDFEALANGGQIKTESIWINRMVEEHVYSPKLFDVKPQ